MRDVSLSTALGSRSFFKERQCMRLRQLMRLIGRQPYITILEGCEVASEGPVGWESPVGGREVSGDIFVIIGQSIPVPIL
jgi:hypothetical protein